MNARGSVSQWIQLLQAGDPAGAQPLWELYFQRLVTLARGRLIGAARGAPATRRTWR